MKIKIKFLKEIAEISLAITAVFGLILGIIELQNQRQLQREEKVIELFIKQYEEESTISEIRSDLYRDYDSSEAFEILQEKNKDVLLNKYKEFIIKFITKDKDRYRTMLVITDFYNGIASCVESKLCDQQTAIQLFKSEGEQFFRNYYPFFCYLHHRWGDKVIQKNSVKFYDVNYEDCVEYYPVSFKLTAVGGGAIIGGAGAALGRQQPQSLQEMARDRLQKQSQSSQE